MWSAVKATGEPMRKCARPTEAGLLASLPRKALPRMLVIRTTRVSPATACRGGRKIRLRTVRAMSMTPKSKQLSKSRLLANDFR